jgi:hypothetical protein
MFKEGMPGMGETIYQLDPKQEDMKGKELGTLDDVDIGPIEDADSGRTLTPGDEGYKEAAREKLRGRVIFEKREQEDESRE